ncbi:MAG TPA: hypothetical protein VLW05_04725 [Gaiellaceae bacterium]|nr:hypothetical protein [Gaiellaceae bacterium]
MTTDLAAGLLLALLSASAINWGYLLMHQAASSLPPLSLRHPILSLRGLFTAPRWLFGFIAGIVGWVFYVVALWLAPLSLVQAASAGGIGVLALLVARSTHVRLARRELMGVITAMVGLILLGLSLHGHTDAGNAGSAKAIGLWIVLSFVAAGLVAGPGARLLAAGAGLGAASGVLYAAGDIATKAAVYGGWRFAFVPVLLACHGTGFVLLQFGFQRGGALATAGVSTVLTNSLPIVAGTVLYSEGIPSGAAGVARVAAFAAVVVGAALLAKGEDEPQPAAVAVA